MRGEACTTLGLSMHSRAGAEGMPLHAVLGTAINQDGRSSSLTAPNGPSQQQVLPDVQEPLFFKCDAPGFNIKTSTAVQVVRMALEDAGLSAAAIGCLEMHGTGTPLGDPIEVGAAVAVFGAQPGRAPLCLGAAKSLLGHTEPAAGATGMTRSMLRYEDLLLQGDVPMLRTRWLATPGMREQDVCRCIGWGRR